MARTVALLLRFFKVMYVVVSLICGLLDREDQRDILEIIT